MGFRTFTTAWELLWYYCFPVCGSPTRWVWDLILSWLHPSYCLAEASSLSLDVEHLFFGGLQHPPIDGCSTASCNFGALIGGGEYMSFYSAILIWKPVQVRFYSYQWPNIFSLLCPLNLFWHILISCLLFFSHYLFPFQETSHAGLEGYYLIVLLHIGLSQFFNLSSLI